MNIIRETKIRKTPLFLDRGIFKLFINSRNTTQNQYNELMKSISMQENISLNDIFNDIEKESINKNKNRKCSRYDQSLNLHINEKFNLEKLINEIVCSNINLRYISVSPTMDEDETVNLLKNKLFYLNSVVAYIVNKLYLTHCKSNNTVPNGRISVPEHLINRIYLCRTKEQAMQNIINAVNCYIDSNGAIHNNIYIFSRF